MLSIDYEAVAQKRRDNYQFLQSELSDQNDLELTLDDDAVPMVYPFLTPAKGIRETLIENKIFVARYWPNVVEWTLSEDFECFLASQMQPLPIDQRYDVHDMKIIIDNLEKIFGIFLLRGNNE